MPTPTNVAAGGVIDTASPTFPVVNPATGEIVTEVHSASADDVRRAVEAAALALPGWAATPAVERARIIRHASEIMRGRIGELAALLTREQGKPVAQAEAEIAYGLGFLDWFADEGRRAYGMTIPAATGAKRITVLRQPIGVTASITPWNFPSAQLLRKVGAALAAGCTMVAKPAELTPVSAIEIERAFTEAGLPAGVFTVTCTADPRVFADVVMADPRVRAITFTGSTEVGKTLMRSSADTVKRVSLELGGHAPLVVFEDADLELAVRETVASKVRNMGQTCVSVNRVYVHRAVREEYTERLVAAMAGLRIGNGLDPSSDVGPLIGPEAVAKVERHIEDAVARGATVLLGGSRAHGEHLASELYFEPTILGGVDESMLVATEETFGPVTPILEFSDEADVVERANRTRFGLAAYFFTRDLNRSVRVSEALEYGAVGINDANTAAVQAPFGGFKESGLGREGGPLGIDEFLETKYISTGGVA